MKVPRRFRMNFTDDYTNIEKFSNSEAKICDSLLKIYDKEDLLNPKPKNHFSRHSNFLDFSKQMYRTKTLEILDNRPEDESGEFTISTRKTKHSTINRKIHGIVPMDKQSPRENNIITRDVPNHYLKYDLVFPRIQSRVNYLREIKCERSKSKGREPLFLPIKKITSKSKPIL